MKRWERQPWALWVRLDQLPGFIITPFVAQLFLFSAAFPEGRAVIPALLLMPLSEQRGDLLTQWVGNHWQNILSKMHCATWCSSIPALHSGKSSSAARHSLMGSSRVCLVIINWCFQLLQLHMGKRKCELWVWECIYRCTTQGHTGCSYIPYWMKGMALLTSTCCVLVFVCVRGTLLPLGTCLCPCASLLKKKFCLWVQSSNESS